MKIILAGGSGYLGSLLATYYRSIATDIVILSRTTAPPDGVVRTRCWDGRNVGPWAAELENADMLVNLTGKNVNCRYTPENKQAIRSSRVDSVRVLGKAIQRLHHPPALWVQCASATIYPASDGGAMDEYTGTAGNGFSEDVCVQWEAAFASLVLPRTRKAVLRTSFVLGWDESALLRLRRLVHARLGGAHASGDQFVSWVHERDFVRVVEWLRTHAKASGVFNCTAPGPIRNADFMRTLRDVCDVSFGIRLPRMALSVGAWLIGTEPELILKSRKVYPQRLLDNGFVFEFPDLKAALRDLCQVEGKRN